MPSTQALTGAALLAEQEGAGTETESPSNVLSPLLPLGSVSHGHGFFHANSIDTAGTTVGPTMTPSESVEESVEGSDDAVRRQRGSAIVTRTPSMGAGPDGDGPSTSAELDNNDRRTLLRILNFELKGEDGWGGRGCRLTGREFGYKMADRFRLLSLTETKEESQSRRTVGFGMG